MKSCTHAAAATKAHIIFLNKILCIGRDVFVYNPYTRGGLYY